MASSSQRRRALARRPALAKDAAAGQRLGAKQLSCDIAAATRAHTPSLSLFSLSLLHAHTRTQRTARTHHHHHHHPQLHVAFLGRTWLCRACLSAVVVAAVCRCVCALSRRRTYTCTARATLDPISPLHSLRTKKQQQPLQQQQPHTSSPPSSSSRTRSPRPLYPRGGATLFLECCSPSPTPPSLFCDLAFGMAAAAAAQAADDAQHARAHTHSAQCASSRQPLLRLHKAAAIT